MTERIEQIQPDLYLDGPSEYLVKEVALAIQAIPQFAKIFPFIEAYKRDDFSMRSLPGLRVYNDGWEKEFDSWFITGDLTVDIIWPPSIIRVEGQQLQDTVSSALCQQFRSTTFFDALCLKVPGLNELGKTFNVDKAMGFAVDEANIVPLTEIRLNFRIDLRQWDIYMEESSRTKDLPFVKTLKSLDRIVTTIEGLRDNDETEVTVSIDQATT